MYGGDNQYLGHILLVFRPHVTWVTNDEIELNDYCIYVKLDLDDKHGDCIAMVTMYPADYDD